MWAALTVDRMVVLMVEQWVDWRVASMVVQMVAQRADRTAAY